MPTDDLIPDWRVQVSLHFGPTDHQGRGTHLLNVRADTFQDLADLLDAVPDDLAAKVANVTGAVDVFTTVVQGTGGSVEVVSSAPTTTQAAGKGYPTCAHGERKYFAKADWQAFFCPLDKGKPGKCDPIFKDKDNKDLYPWP